MIQLRYESYMDNKQLTKKGGQMAMVGAKAKLQREWDQLNKEFASYQYELYGVKKYFDPFGGYDQLGFKGDPISMKYNRTQSILYATYRLLRLIMDLNDDFKYSQNYNSSIGKADLEIIKRSHV